MCLVQIPESHSESLSVLHKNMFNFMERNKKRSVEIVKEINAAAATLWSILFQMFVPATMKIQTIWIL